MLSDEEWKAIKNIKKEFEKNHILPDIANEDLGILLNLIEKQSKEIEELKEKNEHITKETVDFVNTHYISKDKIKTKIEELEKEIIIGAKKTDIIRRAIIYELQSLLEKE